MSVNQITSTNHYGSTVSKTNQAKKADQVRQNPADEVAAVYEKGDGTTQKRQVYQRDTVTVERLMEEAERRSQNLRDLVERMLLQQGQTVSDSTNIYTLLREGKVSVDPETRAQAQRDIAEDGYWGVKQTSARLVSFAKALSGGDPSKADELIAAVKKGFEEATKTWGGELPGICKETIDFTIKQLEEWRDSIKNESMEDMANKTFKNQAAAGKQSR